MKISTRDTSFSFSYYLDPSYNTDQMYEVAFLQDDATKNVLQAATNQPGFQLTPTGGGAWVQKFSSDATQGSIGFDLKSTLSNSADFTVQYFPTSPNVWDVTINGQSATNSQSLALGAKELKSLNIQATQGVGTYSSGIVKIMSRNAVAGDTLVASYPLKFISNSVKIAYVDVAADSLRSANNVATLDQLSFSYVPLTGPEAAMITAWSSSNFPEIMLAANKWILTGEDKAGVSSYIASGGHLFVTGGEIAFGLADGKSTVADRDLNFLKNVLHATYVKDSAGAHTVHGVSNDLVTNGFASSNIDIYAQQVDQSGGNYNQPDEIKVANGGIPIFYYGTGTAQCAGVRWDSSATGAKLVYLAFGLQNLNDADRASITSNVFTWFRMAENGVADGGQKPAELLGLNYPNPFTSTTLIPYSLTRDENVRIAIVDARGTEVAVLANDFESTGNHLAKFDAKALARGTYFCVIHTSEGSAMRAMTVE